MIRFTLSDLKKPEAILLPVFQDQDILTELRFFDKQSGGMIQSVLETKDFEGKKMQISLVYSKNKKVPRIFLLGLGKQKDCTLKTYKNVIGTGVIAAQAKKVKKLHVFLSPAFKDFLSPRVFAKETVMALDTAAYAFEEHKNNESRVTPLQECSLEFSVSSQEKKLFQQGIIEGKVIAQSLRSVRDMGNTPPSIMTPAFLEQQAKFLELGNTDLKVKILSQGAIEKLGMGCLLSVARGSVHEPKFIIIEYFGGEKTEAPIVLVGKGITYDAGGLSLKPSDSLIDMKFDMLGGATVIGVMQAAGKLKLPKNIVGLIPACENMPSGNAYRPDDILTAMNGKTILVENTDAEGRLILADALCYASRYNPAEVIDVATLTGHCLIALGNEMSGLFTKQEAMAQRLLKSSEAVGEKLWQLPMGEEFSEAVKADVADLKNVGGVGAPRFGGASTAAAFLENFTNYPWAHIDMSCSYYGPKGKPWIRGGANGFGLQTIIEYLQK